MKYRCPHCRILFENFDGPHCPSCGKGLRHPEKWKLLKSEKTRREAFLKRYPGTQEFRQPIWMVFMGRPRFLIWVLGGCILVVAFLLSTRMETVVPYRPPTLSAQTQRELVVIRTALEWFRTHCNRYPTMEEGLKALVRDPGVKGWKGNYLESLPPDLWGHPFLYSALEDTVQLSSMGPDGIAGTADDVISPPPDYKALMKRLAQDKR
jgi:general secretion pathway protein G